MALHVIFRVQPSAKVTHVTYWVGHALTVKMEYMAVTVICRVQTTVKTPYVTYKVENAWSVNMGCMVATVIYRVPLTVKTIRVIYEMEHALHVNLDGLEWTVIKVRERNIDTFVILITIFVPTSSYFIIIHANMIFCEEHNLPNVVFYKHILIFLLNPLKMKYLNNNDNIHKT